VGVAIKDAQMKKPCLPAVLGLLLLASTNALLHARQSGHPSVHDTVAGVIKRLKREMGTNELLNLTPAQAENFLTPQEREILATEHLTFRVNVPVRVTVLRDTSLGEQPFWLRARGFEPTNITLKQGKLVYDAWQKDFAAGPVGLGVHVLSGGNNHYLVTLAPRQPRDKIEVSDLYPGQLRLTTFKAGAEPYIDQPDVLTMPIRLTPKAATSGCIRTRVPTAHSGLGCQTDRHGSDLPPARIRGPDPDPHRY
jgi:hypothetical protein